MSEQKSPAEVAVIIPAYNPGAELDECLRSVCRQELTGRRFEVVVVDNGSDPPIEAAWGDAVTVVRELRPGSYAARNAGIRHTQSPLLAFTDADCLPEPGWLEAGVQALDSGHAVVTGPVELFGGEPPTPAELYEFRYGFPQDRYVREGFGVTANLFVTRNAIERAGAFDPDVRSGGDREFGQRLARLGFRTVLVEAAVVRHPARRRIRQLLAKARRTHASTALLECRLVSRRRVVRDAIWLLRPPLRAFYNIIREEDGLRLFDRIRLCGVVMLVRITASWSRLRTVAGATPPR